MFRYNPKANCYVLYIDPSCEGICVRPIFTECESIKEAIK